MAIMLAVPKMPTIQIVCPDCNRTTKHVVAANVERNLGEEGREQSDENWWATEQLQVVRCAGCDTHSFRRYYTNAILAEYDDPIEELWPPRKAAERGPMINVDHLPPLLARIYRETVAALNGPQPILAAVGIRAIVEAVCKHKRAKGHNLKQRIDSLVARGVLTRAQVNVLHKTRFLGNQAAHEAKPATAAVLDVAMQIAENMLTNVYLLKRLAKGMRTK